MNTLSLGKLMPLNLITTKPLMDVNERELMNIHWENRKKGYLTRICKDCGRSGKIPRSFCNDCWNEMNNTIKYKKGSNDD